MGWVCVAVLLVVGLAGCEMLSGHRERGGSHMVALADLPAPAKATVERLTAGGSIKKVECERKGHATAYDVEATVGGKDVEYDVDAGGDVLTSEQSVAYDTLPAAVRSAAEKFFGTGQGLTASSELEGGKTFYEVEGMKDGAKRALKLTDSGQMAEDEEE
jgi:uncharacterized membrane protein YkoI